MRTAREKAKVKEENSGRTSVRVRVRRIEAGMKSKTPEIKKKDVKRLRKGSGILSPGQRKIEAFFLKKTKVGGTGHSRESVNTKQTIQGADIGSLVGVPDSGASKHPSGGSKSLPVKRGGWVK